jgi:FMN phosphatase YigB (HAD superfamily)
MWRDTKLIFMFLVGRALIDDKIFYSYLDSRLLYLINQFGTRIDGRNYEAIKSDIIKNRKLSKNGIEELVIQICRVLMPPGYEKIILKYLFPSIEFAEKHFLHPYEEAKATLEVLSENYKLGIIANEDKMILSILDKYELSKYFNCCIFSYQDSREPNKEILRLVLNILNISLGESVMVGDRLDTQLQTANKLGIITIRFTNSIFKPQEVRNQDEIPNFTISNLRQLISISLEIKPH